MTCFLVRDDGLRFGWVSDLGSMLVWREDAPVGRMDGVDNLQVFQIEAARWPPEVRG